MDREELVERFCSLYQYVVNLTRVIGIDENDVEDVANDAMANAYEALDALRDPEKMKGWLRSIVKNEAKAYYARKKKRRAIESIARLEAGEADLSEFAAGEVAFWEMMQMAEAEEAAKEIMDYLDPVHRSIMYMRFWGGYKFSEIGEILNINDNTVRCMYARCRQKLCDQFGYLYGKEAGQDDRRKERKSD